MTAFPILVYITVPFLTIGHVIAHNLIEKRAAACINIIPSIQSVYYWDNKIETSHEALLLIKTMPNKIDILNDIVQSHHPHELPCVVAVPIQDGSVPFLEWITREVQRVDAAL